jgi:nitrate/TMAO reductase-like tetraheme cytochrome c subunit
MKRLLRGNLFNLTSAIGFILAVASLTIIVLLTLIEFLGHQSHPYMGIVTFIILPGFLNVGFLLMIVGAWRERRRVRKGEAAVIELPHLDLSKPAHRRAVLGLMVGGFMFLMVSAFGSYQAYEHTETVQFCGQVCHDVMKPEYTAYQNSPHARVKCVECHIGPGTTWYVKSKLSGAYQVYSTMFHKYEQPIRTPVDNLRPAKETCEVCHWPKQFYSEKLHTKTWFMTDDTNTKKQTQMMLKIGGGTPEMGVSEGIHYSMYLAHQISYVATDRLRSEIPYIESKGQDGSVTVYRSTEKPITPAQLAKLERHTVDCIECHNRPSHVYHHPSEAMDQALGSGLIDASLPEIKRVAIETLEKPYKDDKSAEDGIQQSLVDFYHKSHPDVEKSKKPQIDAAVEQVRKIYARNYFPYMKVSWKAYPNHLGHMYSAGCFRCHDGKHVSDKGKVLTNDCNSCHTIVSQDGANGKREESLSGLRFRHPIEIGDAWKTMKCSECHAEQK